MEQRRIRPYTNFKRVERNVQTRKPSQDASLPWTKEHEARYSMLYNKFVNTNHGANRDTFIDDNANPRYLMKFVLEQPWVSGTKKNVLYMINRYLYRRGNRYAKDYAHEASMIRKRIEAEEQNNKFEENELVNYRDRQYFTHIIDEKKQNYENHTWNEHITTTSTKLFLCNSSNNS